PSPHRATAVAALQVNGERFGAGAEGADPAVLRECDVLHALEEPAAGAGALELGEDVPEREPVALRARVVGDDGAEEPEQPIAACSVVDAQDAGAQRP